MADQAPYAIKVSYIDTADSTSNEVWFHFRSRRECEKAKQALLVCENVMVVESSYGNF